MKNLPLIKRYNDKYMFFVEDKPFIMFGSEVHNSAASSPEYMKIVWRKVRELHCNTLLVPVYWNLIEKEENKFDFDMVKRVILEARENKIKLVLLWFGSWKNGLSSYAPNWIKQDLNRFPKTENEVGIKTKILSMFCSDIFNVEVNSFRAFLNFIKEFDEKEQTVIAIQIENEVGILGAPRDFSKGADEVYNGTMNEDLMAGLMKYKTINPNKVGSGSWEDIFGKTAPEAFMCYHYASYIDNLAKAGKEIYKLPCFTNVWLKGEDDEAGTYPSGGPEPDMIGIWKTMAPNLDFLSPDIYTFEFEKIAELYTRYDNPLFIPETRRDKWAVANLYTAIGRFNSLCYSPFGTESIGEDRIFITGIIHTDINDKNVSSEMVKDYLSRSYKLFNNMLDIITKSYGTDKIIGFAQKEGENEYKCNIGTYELNIEFYHVIDDDNEFIPGAGIVIQSDKNELIFIGYGYKAELDSMDEGKQIDFLSLEKGRYDETSNWTKYMDLNGDEQYIRLEEVPSVIKALCYEF